MSEPRSLTTTPQNWMTDSRVYNLIWLGRWLERAEGISRAVNSAARSAMAGNSPPGDYRNRDLAEALGPVANTLGIPVGASVELATDILVNHGTSSALHCLCSARLNATQVAPVELIRAIGEAILRLETVEAEALQSAEQVVQVTDNVADSIAAIYEVIEDRWFGREALTEEEVFHRFVQQ
ncbi:MAG: alpha-E domain-containing protein [Chloroflexi bacterium]|nr:alpha-E domain-containing protein [Chloroflexota bacterium]